MSDNTTTWWTPDPASGVGSGDNAWQLTAASLVALQSVPGLVVLYAGIMKKKWAINSAFMALYAFASVLVCWVLWGYKASFGEKMLPFVGKPNNVLGINTMLEQSYLPAIGVGQQFPLATMIYFQFVFAAITLVIMAGAFLGRMNFYAWMVFVPLWLTLSYTVGAFSLWGGGFLFDLGVIDYSGGYVIHLSSGTAGFIGSYWIGPRLAKDREDTRPNNILSTLVGAGILWVGWNGFNGGDPYAASADAGVAVLNTNLCTAISLLTWTACDTLYFKKPSVIGAIQGMITGLVAITPAAGVVAGWGAILLGLGSGSIPWFTMNIVAKKFPAFERNFDDTLGVTHTHMVAGFVGGFGTGLWATKEGCAAFGLTNPGGAVAGNGMQLGYQMAGACFVIGWNLVWTSLILLFIKHVLRIPLRMTEEQLILGDDSIHGEAAYVFGPCEAHDPEQGYIHGELVPTSADETGMGSGNTTHITSEKEPMKNGESSRSHAELGV
ncbi:ammonium transporter AmtB-like domain-containing protein [Ilyonectria robusta]|uniref:ammonium transporter AmtB-like domain-containing protein n=1 Tax=Ilyonectria robusta TaxID=1079257 RepID=UPI001E8D798B|nr:ammonium transporter AmtB-like domain-containing protein [Ilyonectria robusta]KAH8683592.1 ammonium transporter AmtB-like domain-containing protein [Ilyonectria robusta]